MQEVWDVSSEASANDEWLLPTSQVWPPYSRARTCTWNGTHRALSLRGECGRGMSATGVPSPRYRPAGPLLSAPVGVQDGTFKQHPGFIPSGCSGSAANVPVRDTPPPATTSVDDSVDHRGFAVRIKPA